MRWPFLIFLFLSFPHYSNDKKLRRRKRRKRRRGRGEKKKKKKKNRRPSPLSADRPTDSLRSLHAGLGGSRRDGADWMAPADQKKKRKKSDGRRLVEEKRRKKRPGGGTDDERHRRFSGVRVDRSGRLHQTSFMRPSSSHTYTTHTHMRRGCLSVRPIFFYRGPTIGQHIVMLLLLLYAAQS